MPTVAAQHGPRVEVFGGYSWFWLPNQTRSFGTPSPLDRWESGWNASAKLNIAPRIGLLAEFSGRYGAWGREPYTLSVGRAEPLPGHVRQHTFLLGPEVRIWARDRVTMNVRALMGVSHTNSLILPLRTPIQVPPDLSGTSRPPVTELTFPSADALTGLIGGSVDYRITQRLSYRIIQPELLVTRSGGRGTEHYNQSNFRLSTGIVFTSGQSSGSFSGPKLSFGVIGGAALTDAFGHESTGYFLTPNGQIEPSFSRAYSTLKDYVIGPTVDFGLPWSGLSFEIDALYRPLNLTNAGVRPDGSLHSISPATVVTWEFPALLKYKRASGLAKPFIEMGPSFRASGNLNNSLPSTYGGTLGLGVEATLGKLNVGPLIRYTHWAGDDDFAAARSRRNQVELLFGVSF